MQYRKLSENEISEALTQAPGWHRSAGEITREWEFPTYKDGVVFASAVAYLADAMDHHPDLVITYKKVRVSVSTHSVGGLSPFDFELARRIGALG